MGEVDGLGGDGGEGTTMVKGLAEWAPNAWGRGEGGGKLGPGEKESRGVTTSEAKVQGSGHQAG